MASQPVQEGIEQGFGRDSAVREYWLSRCDGFDAIRPDGRRLGRVRRRETSDAGVVLEVGRFRPRLFPPSAVETVWPARSLLVIAGEEPTADEPAGLTRPVASPESLAPSSPTRSHGVPEPAFDTDRVEPVPRDATLRGHERPRDGVGHHPPEPPSLRRRIEDRWSTVREKSSYGRRAAGRIARAIRGRHAEFTRLLRQAAVNGADVTRRALRVARHAIRDALRVIGDLLAATRAWAARVVATGRLRLARLLFRIALRLAGERDDPTSATLPGGRAGSER